MTPHFFKARSRLGIRYLPHGSKEFAFGVEDAPDAILTKDFLQKIPQANISDFAFTKPEKYDVSQYMDLVLNESLEFREFIAQNLKTKERLVVIGGDHSVTFPSILYDLQAYGHNIGIIHFDSHADFNLYKDSPSKNFHGMYLRIFFDHFDLPNFDETIKQKLPISNLLFVGDLELDKEEAKVFSGMKPTNINHKNTDLEFVKNFVKKFDHIHISFDVDVFKKELVSATGTPSKHGFEKDQIFQMLKIIKDNAENFTLDICEVNPTKPNADQTIRIAQKILQLALEPISL